MYKRNLLLILILVLSSQAFPIKPSLDEISKDTTYSFTLLRKAQDMENEAMYDSALYFYQLSAKVYRKQKNFNEYLKCQNKIIDVKRNAGYHSGLLEEAFDNLKLCQKKSGNLNSITADCYNNLGHIFADQKILDSALFHFRKALTIWKRVDESDGVKIAYALRNIGVVFSTRGLFDSARYNINKSIEVLNRRFGKEHPELAGSYNSLGTIAYHLGKLDECEHYFSKVVRIREHSAGKFHPLTAEAYNNLAVLFMAKAVYDTALILNHKAYEIRVSKLPENHPNIALSLNNIGNVYMAMGSC